MSSNNLYTAVYQLLGEGALWLVTRSELAVLMVLFAEAEGRTTHISISLSELARRSHLSDSRIARRAVVNLHNWGLIQIVRPWSTHGGPPIFRLSAGEREMIPSMHHERADTPPAGAPLEFQTSLFDHLHAAIPARAGREER